MILLRRLNGTQLGVNADLIERVETSTDTVLTLVDGTKYIVQESMPEIIDLITTYRATLVARAHDVQQSLGLHVAPDLPEDDDVALAPPVQLHPRRQ